MRSRSTRVGLVAVLAVWPQQAEAQRSRMPPRPATPPAQVAQRPIQESLRISTPDLSIGVEEEEGPYLFGRIGDLIRAPDGTIYVYDWTENAIRAFDASGMHVGTLGRRGRGPGEFVNPAYLLHDGDSTLYASQTYFGITEIIAKGGGMRFRRSYGAGMSFSNLCIARDSLLAIGWKDGRLLHILHDGEVVRSFGDGWARDTFPAVREQMNRTHAHLVCDAANDRIIVAQAAGPLVRAYSLEGSLLWQAQLPSYSYMQTFADARSYTLVAGNDGTGFVGLIDGDRLLVQVVHAPLEGAPRRSRVPGDMPPAIPVRRITSYVIATATGRMLSRTTDAPLLATLDGGFALEVVPDPFPQVKRRTVAPVTR